MTQDTVVVTQEDRETYADEVERVARGLTKAQRACVQSREIIVLRTKWDTRVALNLARKGLAERGRHLNQFVYTPLGLAVRKYLKDQPQ